MRSVFLVALFLFLCDYSAKTAETPSTYSDSLATNIGSKVSVSPDSSALSNATADSTGLRPILAREPTEHNTFWELLGKAGLLIVVFGGSFYFVARKLYRSYSLRSYPYLKTIAQNFHEYSRYEDIDLSTDPHSDEEQTESEKERFTLSEALDKASAIQILGKPGSGKTTALKKLLQSHAATELNAKAWKRALPIYIEYRSGSLFDQILHFLHVNGLGRDFKYLDEKWLRNKLSKGSFLILIDDVHKILGDPNSKTYSRLQELLDYKSNKFVLMSRDFFKRSDFGFDSYHVSSLTDDQVVQILSLQTSRTNSEEIFRHIHWDRKARALYDTPQMLSFLAKAFEKNGKMPLNKSQMFDQFFTLHAHQEQVKGAKYTEMLTRRLLGSLALSMLKQEVGQYEVNEDECLRLLSESIVGLRSKYGYAIESSTEVLDELLRAGTLIRYDEQIRFRHDQWQEFFAALEVFVEGIDLSSLEHLQGFDELAYFIAGLHSLEGDRESKEKCGIFLAQLIKIDFFLFSKCLGNFQSEKLVFVADWHEAYKDVVFSVKEIEDSYRDFLNQYVDTIKLHFPNLYSKFSPRTTKSIGIFIEKKEPKWAYLYAFFEAESETAPRVIVVERNRIASAQGITEEHRLLDYYTRHYGALDFKARDIDPVLYKLPVIGAHDEITDQLTHLVRHKELVEPMPMIQERVYFESLALRNHLGIPRDKMTLSVKDVSEGLRRRDIRESVFQKFVTGRAVNAKALAEETERLFREGFIPERRTGSTTYSGIYSRSINDKVFEQNFSSLLKRSQLKDDDPILPALPLLPREYHSWPHPVLGKEEKDKMIKWSVDYFSMMYKCYKEIIETNFPKSTGSFDTYAHFPLVVALVIDEDRYGKSGWLGSRHIFRNVSSSQDAVKVDVLDQTDFSKYVSSLQKHRWSEYPFWGLPHRHPNDEFLRNNVYEIVEKEFKQLTK